MNVIQVDFWDLMGMGGAIVLLMAGGAWALIQIIVSQFTRSLDQRFSSQDALRLQRESTLDERFKALELAIKSEGEGWRIVERELLELKAKLPVEYVRREDAIRQEVVIHSKLDALAAKIDALRGGV